MLLSPLMGPILGCAFGYAIRDRNLFMTGLKHELLALVRNDQSKTKIRINSLFL